MTNPFQGSANIARETASFQSPGRRRSLLNPSALNSNSGITRLPSLSHPHHELLNPSTSPPPGSSWRGVLMPSHRYSHRGANQDGESPSGFWQHSTDDGFHGGSNSRNFPSFSRAFDSFMSREPLDFHTTEEGRNIISASSAPTIFVNSTGFLSPSYLRGSVYLKRLKEAHMQRLMAQRDKQGHQRKRNSLNGGHANGSGGGSFRGASTGMADGQQDTVASGGLRFFDAHDRNMPKLPQGSHRGVLYELVETPPKGLAQDDESIPPPLPLRWNKDDKHSCVDIAADSHGWQAKCVQKPPLGDPLSSEAFCVRADHHMPIQCGVYYFEVKISQTSRDNSIIGIGFGSRTVSLSRLPGWEPESWGYHSDDGQIYMGQQNGRPFGKTFGKDDVVGCLVNFRLGQASFTLNGVEQGIAFRDTSFKDIKGKLYPVVGLKRHGDHVSANFGQQPFVFDIDRYMKQQKAMVSEKIEGADTSKLAPPLTETELIQQLVLQFLQHDGYVETARAFAEELQEEKQTLSLTGEPVQGIKMKDDEDANKRQQIRRAVLEGNMDEALRDTNRFYPRVFEANDEIYIRLRCRKLIEMVRVAELKPNEKSYDQDEEMLDDEDDVMDDDLAMGRNNGYHGTSATEGIAGVGKMTQAALDYGKELSRDFGNDPRPEVRHHLEDIFALLAYANPLAEKAAEPLLDRRGRVAIAEELNSAILKSLGKSSRAALENVYAQTSVLLDELGKDGGDGAFVTVQSVIDQIPKPGQP